MRSLNLVASALIDKVSVLVKWKFLAFDFAIMQDKEDN